MNEFLLDFEEPLKKIVDKIESLKNSSSSTGIDVTQSIYKLEQQLNNKKMKFTQIFLDGKRFRLLDTQIDLIAVII